MKKKILSLVVCLFLLCAIIPVQVMAAEITSFDITGLTLPIDGAAPDYSASVSQSGCQVYNIQWMDLWTDTWMTGSDRFKQESDEDGNQHNYRLMIEIELTDGNVAGQDPWAITINGSSVSGSGYEFTYYCTNNEKTMICIEGDYVPTKHTCSGGYATCIAPAKCSTCGKEYGSPNPENHDVFGYEKAESDSKYTTHHDVKCDLCKKLLYEEEHYWGPENENGVKPCISCWYTPKANNNTSNNTNTNTNTNTGNTDTNNNSSTHTCSGGYATCIAPAKCSTCGKEYGKPDESKHELVAVKKANTDEKYGTHHDLQCQVCKKIVKDEAHTLGPENGQGVKPCIVCWYTPEADVPEHTCSGGKATCAERAYCDTCGEPYGEVDSNAHTYLETYGYVDEVGHAKICIACAQVGTIEPHVSSEDDKNRCAVCGSGFEPEEAEQEPLPQKQSRKTKTVLIVSGSAVGAGAVASGVVLFRRRTIRRRK